MTAELFQGRVTVSGELTTKPSDLSSPFTLKIGSIPHNETIELASLPYDLSDLYATAVPARRHGHDRLCGPENRQNLGAADS